MRGFFLIDKEKGMTSFDVVKIVRKITGEKKVGHSGTLDPMATGLLLLAVGEGTKLLEYFVGFDKEYEVKGKFGFFSDTYDSEGKIISGEKMKKPKKDDLRRIIKKNFTGEVSQIPPKYSALKVEGKRACDIMRKGGNVELKPRKVRVDNFEIIDFEWPLVDFKINCSSGTYIRSLIHDLGQILGCGAYVENLKRNKIGKFSLENSVRLKDLSKKVEQNLVSLEEMAGDFDRFDLNDKEFEVLRNGGILKDKKIVHNKAFMAFHRGKLVGVLENNFDDSGIKIKKLIKLV